MSNIKTYQRPASLEDAWRLLSEEGKTAKLVGGAVDVGLFAPPEVATLIDLSHLLSTSVESRDGGGLVIGAGVTLTELLESPQAQAYGGGILVTMLRQVASPLLRNAATLGGALASTHPWSDVITLLLALDAQVRRYSGHPEEAALETLLESRGTMDRVIISEVSLPRLEERTYIDFEKFVRTGFDVGMLNCACRMSLSDDGCANVRVVLGGTPDIARRSPDVEAAIAGTSLTASDIEKAAAVASESIPARDDVRASGAYRRILAKAGVRRCLQRMAQKAGE